MQLQCTEDSDMKYEPCPEPRTRAHLVLLASVLPDADCWAGSERSGRKSHVCEQRVSALSHSKRLAAGLPSF